MIADMENRKNHSFKRRYIFASLPIVLIGCYLLIFLVDPTRQWDKFFDRELGLVVREICYSVGLCTVLVIVSLLSAGLLDRWIPWQSFPVVRIFLQVGIQVCMAVVIFLGFLFVSFYFSEKAGTNFGIHSIVVRQAFVVYCSLSVLISFVYTGAYFFSQWRISIDEAHALSLKAANLKRIAVESELQSLKLQLDPHFMFNNFSTLSALINKDKKLSQLFLSNLSMVYRYMIVNIPKNIIALEDEIKLTNAYFYLMKIRLSDNVRLEISLGDEFLKKGIPPITIQLLIENALKHNVASKEKPLLITIREGTDNSIMVVNSLQRINYNIASTKMGLRNIESRYMLLTGRVPVVTETEHEFIVRLPLINLNLE